MKTIVHSKGHEADILPVTAKLFDSTAVEVFRETGVQLDYTAGSVPGKGRHTAKIAKAICKTLRMRQPDGTLETLKSDAANKAIDDYAQLANWLATNGFDYQTEMSEQWGTDEGK